MSNPTPAASSAGPRKRFCLVLVKPTHYDDDGYVIQWFRSAIPSNSLACLFGLARDLAEQGVLGDDVDFDIHALDETNTRIRPERLARLVKAADAGMVMLVGVQSNQTPRALDIARAACALFLQRYPDSVHGPTIEAARARLQDRQIANAYALAHYYDAILRRPAHPPWRLGPAGRPPRAMGHPRPAAPRGVSKV